MLDVLYSILLFLHVVVCALLVLLVMMQRPKQEGLGSAFASGMMNEIAGAQTTDVLQKSTRVLAICFFVLAGSMTVIKAQQSRALLPETTDDVEVVEEIEEEETDAGTAPIVPVEGMDASLSTEESTPADSAPADSTPATPAESAPAESAETTAPPANAAEENEKPVQQ